MTDKNELREKRIAELGMLEFEGWHLRGYISHEFMEVIDDYYQTAITAARDEKILIQSELNLATALAAELDGRLTKLEQSRDRAVGVIREMLEEVCPQTYRCQPLSMEEVHMNVVDWKEWREKAAAIIAQSEGRK